MRRACGADVTFIGVRPSAAASLDARAPPADPFSSKPAFALRVVAALNTLTMYVPVTGSSLQPGLPVVVAMKLAPTARVRVVATVRGCLIVPVPEIVNTSTVTGCVLAQGSPVAGTVTVSCVEDAAVTVAGVPATFTVLFAAPTTKFAPLIVAVAPGVSTAGVIELIVGAMVPAGGATTIANCPMTLSLVAVTVVVPAARAVSTPAASIVAIRVSLDFHAIARPVSTAPFRSFGVAINTTVCPGTIGPDGAATTTLATTGPITVTIAVPLLPSTVAVIVDTPTATPVSVPAASMVATAGLDELHVAVLPASTTPV